LQLSFYSEWCCFKDQDKDKDDKDSFPDNNPAPRQPQLKADQDSSHRQHRKNLR